MNASTKRVIITVAVFLTLMALTALGVVIWQRWSSLRNLGGLLIPQTNPYAARTNAFEETRVNPFENVYRNPFE